MAEVFAATDPEAEDPTTELVVKRVLPHLEGNERYIEMFLREGRVATQFRHPHIVRTYELGEHDGTHYITMEYVEGLTLKELAKHSWNDQEPIPLEVICQMVSDAASGLAHVHGMHGEGESPVFVHRDISPDNLIASVDGLTKILDFGIAKPGDEDGPLTRTGEIKGKVPFMSPEQVKGDSLDGRSDLYSLGITLYWLLTKKRPFDKKSDLLTLNAILQEPTPRPVPWRGEIPEGLEQVLQKMLRKDPKDRFQRGEDVCEALRPFLAGERGAVGSFVAATLEKHPPLPVPPPVDEEAATAVEAGRAGGISQLSTVSGVPTAVTLPSVGEPSALDTATGGAVAQRPPRVRTLENIQVPPPRSKLPLVAALLSAVAVVVAIGGVVMQGRGEPAPAPTPAEPPPAQPLAAAPATTPPDTAATASAGEQPAEPDATAKAAPATRAVKLKAPSHIRWTTTGGAKLASGNASIDLDTTVRHIVAVDKKRGVRTTVRVSPRLDYAALPSGRIAFRITPYAKVTMGQESLGTTPFAPVQVKAGTVRVRLEFEGKTVVRKVKVPAGGTAQVKAKMDE
jgi:serine/threonine-protein kinase